MANFKDIKGGDIEGQIRNNLAKPSAERTRDTNAIEFILELEEIIDRCTETPRIQWIFLYRFVRSLLGEATEGYPPKRGREDA